MRQLLVRMAKIMNRPESKLAAGMVLCLVAVAMLINVALVSCEDGGRRAEMEPGGGVAPVLQPPPPGEDGSAPSVGAGFSMSRVVGEPVMRVRLLGGVTRVRVSAKSGVLLQTAGAAAPSSGPVMGQVEIALQGLEWVGGGQRLTGESVMISAARPGEEIAVNGTGYPGSVRLVSRSDARAAGVFDVVEHVGLETYLPGVVAKEMLANWPAAAYQAQAVCARTYAIHEKLRVGGRGWYDVEAGERDQAYAGANASRIVMDAVKSTRGWVLTDGEGGDLLRAYYSSTCGGRTASASDTWPTGPGFEFNLARPIQASPRTFACTQAPLFRWSIKRDRMELVQRLRAFGEKQRLMVRQIRDLWAIEAMGVNADGRPSSFKVIEPGGKWYKLTGEQLRLALNTNVPASGVNGQGVGVQPGDAGTATLGSAAATGESEALVGPPAPLGAANVIAPPNVDRKSRVSSSDIEVVGPRGGNTVTISGRGFGHGVGMCQYCCRGFAERGEDWRTMVLRFYPGAALRAAY